MTSRLTISAVAVLTSLLMLGAAKAAITKIAISTDPVPEGGGLFGVFGATNAAAPVLNNAGQVAFWSTLTNSTGGANDDIGTYRYSNGVLTKVVRENDLVPGSTARYNLPADVYSLNESGQVAFSSSLRNTSFETNGGLYLHNGAELVELARRGNVLPDGNGTFSDAASYQLNDLGHVRIKANLGNTSGDTNEGMYLHNGSGLVKLARENDLVPEGNGRLAEFRDFKQGFNNSDQVAFFADLRDTSDGFNDNQGIYFHNGTALVKVARENELLPDGNGRYADFYPLALVNSAGQVLFRGALRNTSGGILDNQGIYLHNGSAVVKIARANENVPKGIGKFANFNLLVLNDAGQVAFDASLRNNSNGNSDDSGIYLHNGTAVVQYIRESENVPEGNGQFEYFNRIHLNATGQVAFSSTLRNTSGDITDNIGLYVTDGIETIKVARKKDALVGTTITFLDTTGGYATDLGLRKAFNDFGQLAFRAHGANGVQGNFLFTPEIRSRSTTGGAWDSAGNWTVSLKPGAPHDVTINPTTSITITGPAADVTLRSLTVGNGASPGQPTLNLKAGATVTASAAININDNATIGFEIGGTDAGEFARLATAGIATLDGDLAIQLMSGFMPGAGDMFPLLSAAGGIMGTFDTLPAQLPALGSGLQWKFNYGTNDLVLSVVGAGLKGDYNGNNKIDAADYTVWRNAIAAGATTLNNDPTPGVVNRDDYNYWRDHYGEPQGSGAAVPEPNSLILVLVAALAGLSSRTRPTLRRPS